MIVVSVLLCSLLTLAAVPSLHGARSLESPEVLSVFPLGGAQGTKVDAQVRGLRLESARAVWFDSALLNAEIQQIERIELDETRRGQRLRLAVQIDRSVPSGVYSLRVISEGGVSNPLPFVVHTQSMVFETEASHNTPDRAQPVEVSAVVNGRLAKPGELDYYSIQASRGEELAFEIFSKPAGDAPAFKFVNSGFDARLALYEPTGSWFDPHRLVSLALNDEPVFAEVNANPQLRYRFPRDGRYVLEVSAYNNEARGVGSPDHCYQLRIVPAGHLPTSVSALEKWRTLLARSEWQEQSFERALDPDRLRRLYSRSGKQGGEDIGAPVRERAPNDSSSQAQTIRAPAILEGTIGQPGDADTFRLSLKPGQQLAFEIETPNLAPPQFNPWIVLFDHEGKEVVTNVYTRIGRDPHYRKTVQPKVLHSVERGGEFSVRIRDITDRVGNPGCQYRVLVRPQVPHVGEVQVEVPGVLNERRATFPVDRLNLVAGEPTRVTVVADLEEGFTGIVGVGLEGLPQGVEVLPGAEPEPDKAPPLDEGDRNKYLGRASRATVVLRAHPDAAVTAMPRLVRFVVEAGGNDGPALPVREIPLMVVRP